MVQAIVPATASPVSSDRSRNLRSHPKSQLHSNTNTGGCVSCGSRLYSSSAAHSSQQYNYDGSQKMNFPLSTEIREHGLKEVNFKNRGNDSFKHRVTKFVNNSFAALGVLGLMVFGSSLNVVKSFARA